MHFRCVEIPRQIEPIIVDSIPKKLPSLPAYWRMLSPSNLAEYQKMQQKFDQDATRSRRGEKIDVFLCHIKQIQTFIEQGEQADVKSLVCGIVFLTNAVALNTNSMKILLGKCKSSINTSFQQLGYVAQAQEEFYEHELVSVLPLLKTDKAELKKWTIRFNRGSFDNFRPMAPSAPRKETGIRQPLPLPRIPMAARVEAVQYQKGLPCPVKIRYKIYRCVYNSIGVQTE